jgi:flagellar biosynthesis/type III secretory pathway protein FliH
MLLTEWNTEEWGEVRWEEGWEEGREEGREDGQAKVLELMEQGYTSAEIKAKLAQAKSTETIGG